MIGSGAGLIYNGVRVGLALVAGETVVVGARGTTIVAGGKYAVYASTVNGALEYVGMTSNLAARAAAHLRISSRAIVPVATNLSKFEARALEQVMIERAGLVNLSNRINSIARSNPIYDDAVELGVRLGERFGLW